MKPIAWNAIQISVPDDWELLQFSKSSTEGKLAFADRYQFRLELDWSTVDAPPDLDRMATDYKSKLIEDGIQETRLNTHLPWKGARGLENSALVSRYVNYYPGRSYLLEVVFLWPEPDKYSPSFEGKILDSIAVAPYAEDGQQAWQAFGLGISLQDDHYLKELLAEPAKAEYTFVSPDKREVETIARRGMVDCWLKESVEEWLCAQVPKEYTVTERVHSEKDGHAIVSIKAIRTKAVLVDWRLGRRTIWASAWICPKDQRLYMAAKLAPDYKHGKSHGPLTVSCCDELEVTW